MDALRIHSANKAETVSIDGNSLTIEEIVQVARLGAKVSIAPEGIEKMRKSQAVVRDLVQKKEIVYGITTGFGKFSNVSIDPEQVRRLQENLIVSHAVGVGDPLPEEAVRAIMLLRANAITKGYSGARPEVVQTLVEMLNKGVHPVIPEKGSLGASGDLAPLAHMVLVMIGRGEAYYKGIKLHGRAAMEKAGIPLIRLEAKEGLALINGTQVMTAIGVLALYDAEIALETANITAAMTLEALEGIPAAYDEKIQNVRPHRGQIRVAARMRSLVGRSAIIAGAEHGRVQDAYALRCIPQVHGATYDTLAHVRQVLETEINAATDNPLIFPEEGEVISGGNFHGQPVALVMDFLGIAVAELANIAERRIERLVNPSLNGKLPGFLTPGGGLNSGCMILQYVAAALVSENKVLASPASVDSIPSSANQEDHVSMGTIAARKARNILENVRHVLAIEYFCAAQGIYLLGGRPGTGTAAAYQLLRQTVPPIEADRELRLDVRKVKQLIDEGQLLAKVNEALAAAEVDEPYHLV